MFAGHFMLAQDQGWVPTRSDKQMWEDAKTNVHLDLQNCAFKQGALTMADRLERDHFSLKLSV